MKLPAFPVEGGCQCGAVRYRLKAAPLGVYACHCKDCQRFSGTTHTLSMVVKAGAEPAFVATRESRGWVAPKPGAVSVDPTGAGDSFNGAYLSARAQGASPLEAAAAAHRLAAQVIAHRGALVPHEMLER